MRRKKSKLPHQNSIRKLDTAKLRAEISRLFLTSPKKQYSARQLIQLLGIENTKDSVEQALLQLTREGLLQAGDGTDRRYRLRHRQTPAGARNSQRPSARMFYEGRVDMARSGAAYIICQDLKEDVYVPARNLNGALNKDRVRVEVLRSGNRRRPEGQIVEILQRATEQFVGTLSKHRKWYVVTPDGLHYDFDIFIPFEGLAGAEPGDKVIARVTEWPGPKRVNAKGHITEVLGQSGSSDIEMKTILISQGFELDFPGEVMREAMDLPANIFDAEIARRRDFRDILTFTIDPVNAKDFDDAISYRELENGSLEIGVHIADVAHYVQPGSALDRDALKRATSVYLVDRVLPMLPERLSNELCSLRPNEDKLTFSAVFEIDRSNKVTGRWFGRTVIHSDRRFTYEEAQEILEGADSPYADPLHRVNEIAKHLRKERFRHGSIDFDSEEVQFRLDEKGAPIDVYVKERKDAHFLIEEFMLLANKEVALFISRKEEGQPAIPFIYRVHDLPNMEKLEDFARFAAELGVRMDLSTPQQIADSFNKITARSKEDPILKLLEPLAIRTMAKAEYSANNIGHYGLGFSHYTHFTSPIRRYSDVLAHRILYENLHGTYRVSRNDLDAQCRHISVQERKAMDAERESVKYKQVEYLERFIGSEFDGKINGIIDRGFFVELTDNKCEGMVSFDTMSEPFHIDDSRLKARGLVTGQVLKMGDRVRVRVIATDLIKRQVELELAEFGEDDPDHK